MERENEKILKVAVQSYEWLDIEQKRREIAFARKFEFWIIILLLISDNITVSKNFFILLIWKPAHLKSHAVDVAMYAGLAEGRTLN